MASSDKYELTLSRRALLRGAGGAAAVTLLPHAARAALSQESEAPPPAVRPFRFAVKYGMVGGDGSIQEKFQLLKNVGFDGVELDSPNSLDPYEVLRARDESGLPIHGVVDSIHWRTRLSDPDPNVRIEAMTGLKTAIRDAKTFGGSSVLLVPGRVADPTNENHDQVWARSIEGIREALPLAAELGVHILIENVWNGFLYEHNGGADQSAQRIADYIDEIGSPWVGSYFDIGNHRKYGNVEDWIRTLGHRIVKLDCKDWGVKSGFSKIGDGDVNWPAVRQALSDIRYTGWVTAEVGGGEEERMRDIKARMDQALLAT